jgi:hypothetical protein
MIRRVAVVDHHYLYDHHNDALRIAQPGIPCADPLAARLGVAGLAYCNASQTTLSSYRVSRIDCAPLLSNSDIEPRIDFEFPFVTITHRTAS